MAQNYGSSSPDRSSPLLLHTPRNLKHFVFKKSTGMNSELTFNPLGSQATPNIEELLELQGECRIDRFEPLRRNWWKTILMTPLLVLATALILLGVMRKRRDVSARLMYDQCAMAEATHVLIVGNDRSMEIVDHTSWNFTYRKVTYQSKAVQPYPVACSVAGLQYFERQEEYKELGLSGGTVRERQLLYGLCEHTVDIPSLPGYLADEMLGIFFILQYITCAIYVLEGFIFFGVALIGTSLISTIINYFLLRSSYLKIKELAEHSANVQVVREGKLVEIDSKQLVPGDIFVPTGTIPCDCVLVDGELYLNESSLTGESVPIGKSPALSREEAKLETRWLFEGTSVLESRGQPLALAVHTGFVTRKGRIFRKILFRQHIEPEFYWYAFYFLLEVFVYCTVIFLGMIPLYLQKEISTKLMVLRFFDMVGWAVPPSFPIIFNVCYSVSLYRLRKESIFGTEPYKTIVSGKVTVMCFDKTGTLTRNEMQLNSLIRFAGESQGQTIRAHTKLPASDILCRLMASCHTVRRVSNEFMGDQLDLRMFLYSGFSYEVPLHQQNIKLIVSNSKESLEILRINQFESKFQAMSVLVRDVNAGKYYIFVKGAPEKIQKVSTNQVAGFQKLLSDVSLAGLRCLAVAYRQVKQPQEWVNAPRESFERGLTMIGLATFDNLLKEDTAATIQKLSDAEIEVKVITGDNIYIAVETAIRTNILQQNEEVLVLQGGAQSQTPSSEKYVGELLSRKEGKIESRMMEFTTEQLRSQTTYAVAIDNAFLKDFNLIPRKTKIFARITPESKAQVIKLIKAAKKNQRKEKTRWERLFGRTLEKVGMVGDGANDIMAIKQADLGIGISDSDSSFAANFSIGQLMNVQYILRQGKSTLSVVIDVFRYYGGVSVLKYISNCILIYDRSSFNDNQFTYLNYFSTIEILFFMTLTRPAARLSRFLPNDNLMSLESRLVFIGHVLIPTVALLVLQAILVSSSFYIPNTGTAVEQWPFRCLSNTVIFLPSHLFYIWNIVWIYTSQPWKQPLYQNIFLTVWLCAIIVVNSVLFFFTESLTPFFDITAVSLVFGAILFGVTYFTVLCGLFWKLIIDALQLQSS